MTRLEKQLVKEMADCLFYLDRPGASPVDEEKAKKILRDRVPKKMVKAIQSAPAPGSIANIPGLADKLIVLWPGHQPGGGTTGERAWNIRLASIMRDLICANGGECKLFRHSLKPYGVRQNAMRSKMISDAPNAVINAELHYNGVSYDSAHGHEFMFYGTPALAGAVRDSWQATFAHSKARHDNGIRKVGESDRGAGFLRKSPCASILHEPFFYSNPSEKSFYLARLEEIARVNVVGYSKYLMEFSH